MSSVPRSGAARLALAGLGLLLACGGLPQPVQPAPGSGRERPEPPPVLSTPWSDEDAGAKAAEQVEAELGLVETPEIVDYVQTVGARLALRAPGPRFDYAFRIVDEDAPNAFSLPGGYVFVSRGALALSNSEDELAGVLGHEIVHAAARHAAARQGLARGSQLFELLMLPYLAAYSRDLERTADSEGQALAAAAGYDPGGIARFLRGLDALERVQTGAARIPGFLDTHPGTRSRAVEVARRAQQLAWTPAPHVTDGRLGHLRKLEGLVVGPSGAQGLFRGSRFLHPDLGFTLLFPEGWELHNTPRAVGAIAPDRNAQVFLEVAERGDDARAVATKWVDENLPLGVRVDAAEPIVLAGKTAWRLSGGVRVGGEPMGLVVTFVPWRGLVYRIVGISRSMKTDRPGFLQVARSFRPMTPELLARVTEKRLRLAQALPGESLARLSARTGNVWPLQETAVMNALPPDAVFAGDEWVKIALEERYEPKPVPVPEPPPPPDLPDAVPDAAPPEARAR